MRHKVGRFPTHHIQAIAILGHALSFRHRSDSLYRTIQLYHCQAQSGGVERFHTHGEIHALIRIRIAHCILTEGDARGLLS